MGPGDEHLEPRNLGAIVNKRLVGSGGEWRRQLSSVNEPPCLTLELSPAAHTPASQTCPTGALSASQRVHNKFLFGVKQTGKKKASWGLISVVSSYARNSCRVAERTRRIPARFI